MNRTNVINAIIAKHEYGSYFEVGVRNRSHNFDKIVVPFKLGIEVKAAQLPDVLRMHSDKFFSEAIERGEKYALFFIDGDHREAQVAKDLKNALRCLEKGGTIVLHDCHPTDPMAVVPEKPDSGQPWNGQAYRVFLAARRRKDLIAYCVDTDHGVGVIQRGRGQSVDVPTEYAWLEYMANAREWLGLVSPEVWEP